jgi:hypothetical protein
MSYRWLRTTLCSTVMALSAATAGAQQPNWNVEVGTGVAATTGEISSRLTNGWNVGAGYRITSMFELDGNLTVNGLGVSRQALKELEVPDGNASLLSLTVGPKIHFPIASSVRGYV